MAGPGCRVTRQGYLLYIQSISTEDCPTQANKSVTKTTANTDTGNKDRVKKGGKSSGKKDAQLVLRLDKSERDAFVDLCKELDTSAAREIRRFIRGFLKENSSS